MRVETLEYLSKLNKNIEETEEMRRIYTEAAAQKIPVIRKDSGRMLYLLTLLKQPRKILEIGTGSGYSAMWLLKGTQDIVNNCSITTIERDKKRFIAAEALFSEKDVTVIHGDAFKLFNQSDENNLYNHLDLVFLDAQKRDYIEYLAYLTDRIKPGGLLITDNIVFGEKISQPEKDLDPKYLGGIRLLKEYNQTLAKSPFFDTLFLGIDDGLSVSVRKGGQNG